MIQGAQTFYLRRVEHDEIDFESPQNYTSGCVSIFMVFVCLVILLLIVMVIIFFVFVFMVW